MPLCFGAEAPWHASVPEAEFARRVKLTEDQCVVNRKVFFVRGHIEIPILDFPEPLSLSVWSSLSKMSFQHMAERWDDQGRGADAPYFGWLSNSIEGYPETLNLKLSVQSRAPGLVPLFTVEPTEHPLALDQQQGISVGRWHELAHKFLHERVGPPG